MDSLLEKIGKILDQIEHLGIDKHILRIWDFVFHPRKFWNEYKILEKKEKVIQFITYGGLYGFVIWLTSFGDPSYVEVAKQVTIQATLVVYYVIAVSLGNVIISWKKGGLGFIVILCCYVKFLFSIPQLLALKAYYNTEYPLALAIAVIVPVICELLCLGYAAMVWQRGRNKVLGAFLLSIVTMNITDFAITLTGWEKKYNEFSDNLIVEERKDLLKSLNGVYDIPVYVCYGDSDKVNEYIVRDYYDQMGEAVIVEASEYKARIKEDLDSLREMISRCKFKTNKEFFDDLYKQKSYILNTNKASRMKNPTVMTGGRVWDSDTILVNGKSLRKYEKLMMEGNFSLMSLAADVMHKHQEAYAYSKIAYVWHWYMYYYNNNKFRRG